LETRARTYAASEAKKRGSFVAALLQGFGKLPFHNLKKLGY